MRRLSLLGLLVFSCNQPVIAYEAAQADQLRQDFNRRYQDYQRPDSQSLLPFTKLEKEACQNSITSGKWRKIYSEPGKAYNAKVYTFTFYQDGDGHFFLDAKGGFWGMDELCYGPVTEQELR